MKKTLMVVVALLLVFSMLAACGNGSPTTDSPPPAAPEQPAAPPPPATPEEPPEEAAQITADLTMWTGTWNDGKMEELLARFQVEYPGINVNFEYGPWDGMEDRYFAAMQAGTIPDIIDLAIAWTIPFARMGNLVALDDLAVRHGLDLQATYYPGGLASGEVDGLHYALPYRTEVGGIIYNKDLFEQAGLDPERGPETWDELIEMGLAVQALGGGISGFGQCGAGVGNTTFQVYSLWFSNGVELLNADHSAAAFNTPAAVEALEFWANEVRSIAPASVLENDNTVNRNLFAEGLLGMYFTGPFDLAPLYEANPNLNLGFVRFPVFSSSHPVRVQQGGWNIAMTRTVPDDMLDPAFLWIKFLASPEISVIFSDTISAARAAINDPTYSDPDFEMFLASLELGKPVPGNIAMNAITSALFNEFQAVLAGIKDAQTALNDGEATTNDLLHG